jgi:hypothetical protein
MLKAPSLRYFRSQKYQREVCITPRWYLFLIFRGGRFMPTLSRFISELEYSCLEFQGKTLPLSILYTHCGGGGGYRVPPLSTHQQICCQPNPQLLPMFVCIPTEKAPYQLRQATSRTLSFYTSRIHCRRLLEICKIKIPSRRQLF